MYLDIANLVFFSGVINRLLFSLVFIRLFSFALLASDRFHCLIKFSQAFLSIVQRGLQDRILHFYLEQFMDLLTIASLIPMKLASRPTESFAPSSKAFCTTALNFPRRLVRPSSSFVIAAFMSDLDDLIRN